MHIRRYKTAVFALRIELNSLYNRITASNGRQVIKTCLPFFAFTRPEVLQKISGFSFQEKELTKCIYQYPRPQQHGGDHEKTTLRHTERRRSVSQIVSIHQERLRLQTLSLLQKKEWMHLDALSCVGYPAWMRRCFHRRSGKKPFSRTPRMPHSKNASLKYITERMMQLWYFKTTGQKLLTVTALPEWLALHWWLYPQSALLPADFAFSGSVSCHTRYRIRPTIRKRN